MLKTVQQDRTDTAAVMADIGRRAKAAARALAIASTAAKNAALEAMAEAILRSEAAILKANAVDLKDGEAAKLSKSLMDRLTLTPSRIHDMAEGVRAIAALADP